MRRYRRGNDNRPPNFPFELNRASPQAKGLVGWWPTMGSCGANVLRDFSLRANNGVFVATPDWVLDPDYGWVVDLEEDSSEYVSIGAIPALNQIIGPIAMSAWVWGESFNAGGFNAIINSGFDGTNQGFFLRVGYNDRISTGSYKTVGGDYRLDWTYGEAFGTSTWALITGLYDGANWKVYLNGIERASVAKAVGAAGCTSGITLGSMGAGRLWDGKLADCRIYDRGLSPVDVWQLWDPDTRYDLYLPVRRIWVLAPPPAGVVVTVPAASLALTGYAPSVQTPVTITVPVASLTLIGYVPTAQTPVSVTVPVASLSLAGYAPAVQTPVLVTIPAASLTLAGYVPTVQTPVSIAVPVASLTLTGYVPLVQTPVTVTVPAASLTLTGYVPIVQTPVVVTVPVASLTLAGYAPTVQTPGLVEVPVASLMLTGYVPTITVSGAISIEIPVASLALSAFSPIVTTTGNVSFEVPTASLTLMGYAPSVIIIMGTALVLASRSTELELVSRSTDLSIGTRLTSLILEDRYDDF